MSIKAQTHFLTSSWKAKDAAVRNALEALGPQVSVEDECSIWVGEEPENAAIHVRITRHACTMVWNDWEMVQGPNGQFTYTTEFGPEEPVEVIAESVRRMLKAPKT